MFKKHIQKYIRKNTIPNEDRLHTSYVTLTGRKHHLIPHLLNSDQYFRSYKGSNYYIYIRVHTWTAKLITLLLLAQWSNKPIILIVRRIVFKTYNVRAHAMLAECSLVLTHYTNIRVQSVKTVYYQNPLFIDTDYRNSHFNRFHTRQLWVGALAHEVVSVALRGRVHRNQTLFHSPVIGNYFNIRSEGRGFESIVHESIFVWQI